MKADTIDVLLDDLLMACEDAYELVDDAPPAPGAFLKVHGSPVWDQPQVAVLCNGIRPLVTQANKCLIIPVVDLVIEVVRAGWPGFQAMVDGGGAPPETTDLHEAVGLLARDAMTLFMHICERTFTGDLFPTITERGGRILCGDVTVGTTVPLQPSGNYAGWRWPLTVALKIP